MFCRGFTDRYCPTAKIVIYIRYPERLHLENMLLYIINDIINCCFRFLRRADRNMSAAGSNII